MVKFGEIDAIQILQNEYKIRLLERILEFIINNNPVIAKPSQTEVKKIQEEIVAELQAKYPQSGIKST